MPIPFVIENQEHRLRDALKELLAGARSTPAPTRIGNKMSGFAPGPANRQLLNVLNGTRTFAGALLPVS